MLKIADSHNFNKRSYQIVPGWFSQPKQSLLTFVNFKQKAEPICEKNTCRSGGFVEPICCSRAGNTWGFLWMTRRICWNCGWFRRNSSGFSKKKKIQFEEYFFLQCFKRILEGNLITFKAKHLTNIKHFVSLITKENLKSNKYEYKNYTKISIYYSNQNSNKTDKQTMRIRKRFILKT